MGTSESSGSTVLRWTTPLIRTSDPAPITALLKTAEPIAKNTLSSTVQPVRYARGPTRMWSPMRTGCFGVPRTTAFSMTMHSAPISTAPPSAVTTAPNRTRLFAPTVTSPQIVAVGAT